MAILAASANFVASVTLTALTTLVTLVILLYNFSNSFGNFWQSSCILFNFSILHSLSFLDQFRTATLTIITTFWPALYDFAEHSPLSNFLIFLLSSLKTIFTHAPGVED